MEAFFALIQKTCLPGVWSKAMALSRSKAVISEPNRSEGEKSFRVLVPNRPVTPKVTLIPDDEDWFCDCDEKANPCTHVAAAVIALKTDTVQAVSATAGTTSRAPQIQYRFVALPGPGSPALTLERWIIRADQEPMKLTQTLVSFVGGITSGRIESAPLAATQEDFALDQALGTQPATDAPLPSSVLRRILSLLQENASVRLKLSHENSEEDKLITCSGIPLGVRAILSDSESGFSLQRVSEPSVTTSFSNGAVLLDALLRPTSQTELSALEQQLLAPQGFSFSAREAPGFVSEILPALQSKIQLEIQTKRLPQLIQAEPEIQLQVERGADGALSVLPRLVYPGPDSTVLAELIGEKNELTQNRLIPSRDPGLEKQLTRKLQSELFLQPRQRVSYSGTAAIEMARKLKSWKVEGDAQSQFEVKQKLTPRVVAGATGLQLSFHTAPSAGPDAGPDAGGQSADPARVFQAWRENESFVPLLGGGFAPLPLDWLRRYGAQIQALLAEKNRADAPELPKTAQVRMALLCQEMAQASSGAASGENPEIVYESGIDLLMNRLMHSERIPESPLPSDLTAELRDYQKKGVHWLCFLRDAQLGAMLADDMGLGKTLQAMCAIQGRTLIVCPTSVLQAWKEQLTKFRPALRVASYHGPNRKLDPDADVILTTYGLLRLDQSQLLSQDWQTLIMDEAQILKNPESQITQAAHLLARTHSSAFRIALSGTPLENRMEDLWSQFEFINPGLLGSRENFREASSRIEALRRKLKPFILRRLKKEVAPELPERTEIVLRCELSEGEQRLYDSLLAATRTEVLQALENRSGVFAMLEILLRLRQASCHPALVPGGTAALDAGKPSSKVELLLQSLDTSLSLGHRALIFSQWTSFLDIVEAQLKKRNITHTRLDGTTRDREAVVNAFQAEGGPSVMLISLKAGGVGLTLTAADHIYILDPWWNPAVEDQAADRAHRIGQKNPVFIHRLVASETVEDRILELQTRKRELASSVLEGGSAALSLTREDLISLLT